MKRLPVGAAAPGAWAGLVLLALTGCELVLGFEETREQGAAEPSSSGGVSDSSSSGVGSSRSGGQSGSATFGGTRDVSAGGGTNGGYVNSDSGAGVGAPASGGGGAANGDDTAGSGAGRPDGAETAAGRDSGSGGEGAHAGARPSPVGGASGSAGIDGNADAGAPSVCAADDDPVGIAERIPRVQRPWPFRDIPVCYVASSESITAHDSFRYRSRLLFESNWQRFANINWLGWDTCVDAVEGIVISITDSEPSGSGIGYPGTPGLRVVTLNVGASDAEILYWFGRALGLDHEYGRSCVAGRCVPCEDSHGCGEDRPDCLPSGFCGRRSDHESILAPPDCGGIESIRKLSSWDIAGLQRAYGRKPRGSLVHSSGFCANVDTPSRFPGDEIVPRPCRGEPSDTWHFDYGTELTDSDRLAVWYTNEERCMAVWDDPVLEWSTMTYIALCDWSSKYQNFRQDAVWLRGMGGLCVVATPERDQPLRLQRCGELGPADRWEIRAGRLRLSGTDLCATVRDVRPVEGTPIILDSCAFASNARQDYELADGSVRAADYCWNLDGGSALPGSSIVLGERCDGELASFFSSGPVHAPSFVWDQNLTLDGSVCVETPAADAIDQQWDFYW